MSTNPKTCLTCNKPLGEGDALDCGGDCLGCTREAELLASGFVWEYRAVILHGDETKSPGAWYRDEGSIANSFVRKVSEAGGNAFLERRLVGPATRVPTD